MAVNEQGVDKGGTRRVPGWARVVAVVALLGIVGVIAYLMLGGGAPDPEEKLDEFLSAYEAQDYAAAAGLTNAPGSDVAERLEANVVGLDGATLDAEVLEVEEDEATATASVRMSWDVPGIGEFAYDNDEIELEGDGPEDEDYWKIRWDPTVVHPALDSAGTRLGTTREYADRAPILDRDGAKLVIPRPVIEIGVIQRGLDDAQIAAAVDAIAQNTEADAKALTASLEAAESPDSFVPAITLRQEEFAEIEDVLGPIPGIEFGGRELPLAPTKEFARALLGSVGPITEEQLGELGAPYAVGDNVGQSGLQLEYEKQLAGTPDRAVITRLADGTPADTLYEVEGERGKALRTTLDGDVQVAAEEALGSGGGVRALVAIEPSSGDVLAAATRPVDDAFNRALEGQYPPGSTFKVVTTEALLAAGLDPDETVDCPPTITVGGRSFRNFEGSAAGAVPFRTDFAESCNTAFISLADRLEPQALPDAGELFGFGRKESSAVTIYSGDVPEPTDEVEEAASMIGQGRILASPVVMAGVAAAVADGRARAPRVLASDPREAGPPIPEAELTELRSMMRDVVTQGTGTALAGLPGEPIGKSGTAEYGSGVSPPTHAWFIAARDDVAVAVLIEDKPSGGEFAAPVAARFLEGI